MLDKFKKLASEDLDEQTRREILTNGFVELPITERQFWEQIARPHVGSLTRDGLKTAMQLAERGLVSQHTLLREFDLPQLKEFGS